MPVTRFLRTQHPAAVRAATAGRHVGLILLLVLLRWPDTSLAGDFMRGFATVGFAPPCRVFAQQPSTFFTLDDIYRGGPHDAKHLASSIRPGPHDDLLAQAGVEDERAGFCGPELTFAQVRSLSRFRILRRFVIQQGSGKNRVIDDAFQGGQSGLSSDSDKLDLCQGTQPAYHVQILARALRQAGQEWDSNTNPILSGGEDLPNAYRHTPMRPAQADACIIAYWSSKHQAVRFRRYNGLQDFALTASSTQATIVSVPADLGSPFSDEKRQQMAPRGDFLGLEHDLTRARSDGLVEFWIRPRLIAKIRGIIDEARDTQQLSSGWASKLYGCVGFLSHASYGRVARAGLQALQQRQQDHTTQALMPDLRMALDVILSVLAAQPRRISRLFPSTTPRFVVASDASQDAPLHCGAGALLVSPSQERVGCDQTVKIAQLELLGALSPSPLGCEGPQLCGTWTMWPA